MNYRNDMRIGGGPVGGGSGYRLAAFIPFHSPLARSLSIQINYVLGKKLFDYHNKGWRSHKELCAQHHEFSDDCDWSENGR